LTDPIRAVDRSLNVLLCFSRDTPALTMTQIAEKVGLNKSTVHRLLATLEQRRFLERDAETGVYRLGIRMLQMAYLTLETNVLRKLASPFLQRLCEQFGETVNLAVLDDADVLFLDVNESPQRVKLAASIGQRLPAFSTASGKAILAHLPVEEVHRILANGMPQHTPYTITSPGVFFENLAQIRQQGYAISTQEYEEGINVISAPIFDSLEHPIGSISIAGPTYRLPREKLIEISPTIITVAREISEEVNLVDEPDLRKYLNDE
jgi:IclR family KDG regulon transcriptional repressor